MSCLCRSAFATTSALGLTHGHDLTLARQLSQLVTRRASQAGGRVFDTCADAPNMSGRYAFRCDSVAERFVVALEEPSTGGPTKVCGLDIATRLLSAATLLGSKVMSSCPPAGARHSGYIESLWFVTLRELNQNSQEHAAIVG